MQSSSSSSSLSQATGFPENWSALSGCLGADNRGRAGVAFDVVSSLIRLQTPGYSTEWQSIVKFYTTQVLWEYVWVNPPTQKNFYFRKANEIAVAARKIENLMTALRPEISVFKTVKLHEISLIQKEDKTAKNPDYIPKKAAFTLPGQFYCGPSETFA